MAKFVIECPVCGKYAEGKTGFFAKKKLHCDCGNIIHVKTDNMTSRECPHCKNMVVFDQLLGARAKCPVCHEPINTMAEQNKMEEITCGQCGIKLVVSKAATVYTCPVCDFINDVAERAAKAQINKEGLASVIKYEGDGETFVWKHPIEDFNYGSQLIVHESQEAIFFRNGQALDLFGAGRYTLETQQLPLLEKIYKLPTDSEATFHSEVYYINLSTVMGVKWGTDSKIRLFDPASGLHLELGACGEFNIRVTNSRKLLVKIVGTSGGLKQTDLLGTDHGKGYFKAMIMTQVKSHLAQAIKARAINILEIDEHLMELSDELRLRLNEYLQEYGLEIPEFFVSRVITPDDDPNYRRLKEQYAEQYLLVRQEQIRKNEAEAAAQRKAVEAQTAAQMKTIGAQGEADALRIQKAAEADALRLQKAAEADAYRMQAEAEAAEMKMKGYTYQQETARQVGLGATEAMATSGVGSGIGEVAGLGMTLGAMGSVIGMTKDAMSGVVDGGASLGEMAATAINSGTSAWNCTCGTQGITFNFCPNCGNKRPVEAVGWNCPSCGMTKIKTNFCPNCGTKRPDVPVTWNCSCGTSGIRSNFCPNCGKKREE